MIMSTFLEAHPTTTEHPSMVVDQLDALLGEHLMPLRLRDGNADEPYLLAVDGSGQPVVVEVVGLLDAAAVLTALRHAGRASQMSTRDLANAYRGGADRFASHLAAFRLTLPKTALLSTFVRGGARLLLVCSQVAPDVSDVVDFLLQPGWQVDVLQVTVHVVDGMRVADVSPISTRPAPSRTTEPWARNGRSNGQSTAYGSSNGHSNGHGVSNGHSNASSNGNGYSHAGAVRAPAAAIARPAPVVQPPSFAVKADPWPVTRPDPRLSGERRPELRQVNRPTPRPFVPRPDPRLAVVADDVGAPVALVWLRERHGECYEALLHADGTLELPNGTRFADPDAAARAVSGSERPVDGWRAWHIGSLRGPALADLVAGLR